MPSIWALDPEMIQHTLNIFLTTGVTFPAAQSPQDTDFRTILRHPRSQNLESYVSVPYTVAREPNDGETAMAKLVKHRIAVVLEDIVEMYRMEPSRAVVQSFNAVTGHGGFLKRWDGMSEY